MAKNTNGGKVGRPKFTAAQREFQTAIWEKIVFGLPKGAAAKELKAKAAEYEAKSQTIGVKMAEGKIDAKDARKALLEIRREAAIINSGLRSVSMRGTRGPLGPRKAKKAVVEAAAPVVEAAAPVVEAAAPVVPVALLAATEVALDPDATPAA